MELVKKFKKKYPKKSIWVWTGFLYEDIVNKDILKYIDVLVDGVYIDKLYNPTLKWKGSSNQRVIDVVKTLKSDKVVEVVEGDLVYA